MAAIRGAKPSCHRSTPPKTMRTPAAVSRRERCRGSPDCSANVSTGRRDTPPASGHNACVHRRKWASLLVVSVLSVGVGAEAAVSRRPQIAAAAVNVAHAMHLTPYTARAFDTVVQIPYPTTERDDPTHPRGVATVVQPGRPGLARETGVQLARGGVAAVRKVYGEQVLRPPQPATVAVGTSTAFVHVNGQYYHYARSLTMVATAYDAGWASNGPWTGQATALGIPLQYGVVAVDPRVIPLGSRLYVQGYGLAVAADTGSAIQGDRIDLFFWNSPVDTAAFGIRHLQVYVLDDPRLPPLAAGGKPAPAGAPAG
jgi:3D (Asp-Asp-Asp) domain-containing protein